MKQTENRQTADLEGRIAERKRRRQIAQRQKAEEERTQVRSDPLYFLEKIGITTLFIGQVAEEHRAQLMILINFNCCET